MNCLLNCLIIKSIYLNLHFHNVYVTLFFFFLTIIIIIICYYTCIRLHKSKTNKMQFGILMQNMQNVIGSECMYKTWNKESVAKMRVSNINVYAIKLKSSLNLLKLCRKVVNLRKKVPTLRDGSIDTII